ncbi:MAG: hypothetical protein J7M21_03830 [Planctomycetes bacterium]|nr:hypothetical protein [Planctomycetota bacterium]
MDMTAGIRGFIAVAVVIVSAAPNRALCEAPRSAGAAEAPAKVAHRFLKAGWRSGGPGIVGRDGRLEWSLKDGRELSDAWALPDGGIVYSFSQRNKEAGIIRLGPDKKRMWVYHCQQGRDNHSCQPLPGGRFLAGEVSKDGAWMVEVDARGRKVKEVKVQLAVRNLHHTFRNVRKTPQGTYLAAVMCENKTYEWDADGKLIRTFPNGRYVAVRLSNGHTVTSGSPRNDKMGGITEYDEKGDIVWALTKADFEKLGLRVMMICGLQVLPNGDVVFGKVRHGSVTAGGKYYKLVEISRDKKLIWAFDGGAEFSKIEMGSFQILDVGGDPRKFEVIK